MPGDRRRQILEDPIGRVILRLAAPVMLGNLLQTGYQLTDAFWIGQLGAAALAAVAISVPVTFLVIAMGAGFAMAGATLLAQYAGAGQQEKVEAVVGQTLLLVALISVVLGAAGYAATPWLLHRLGVAPDAYAGARGFMRVSFVGVTFVFLYTMFQALMRSVGQTTVPLFIVAATVALNFALDPLFIFGWGPFPPSGVMGAALATLTTQGLATVAGIALLVRGTHGLRLLGRHLVPDLRYIGTAFAMGLPASVEMAVRGLSPIALSTLAAGFGTVPLAAYGIGANIMLFASIPAMGLSMAVATLVGQNLGAGRLDRATRAAAMGALWGGAMLGGVGALAFVAAVPLVTFFTPRDGAVIAEAARFIRIMCWTWIAVGVQLSLTSTLRAAGNMAAGMAIALVAQLAFQIPFAWILSHRAGMGIAGLWWSFPASNLLAAGAAAVWFLRSRWQLRRIA